MADEIIIKGLEKFTETNSTLTTNTASEGNTNKNISFVELLRTMQKQYDLHAS